MNVSELNTATRGHHPDSPSSLQSSSECAFFVNRNTESAASAAGTLKHKAAETRDFSILDDPEDVAAVERCIAIEDAYVNRLKAEGFEVEMIHEEYLAVCPDHTVIDSAGQTWSGITGGYPDTLILARKPAGSLAVIPDWKFGKMLVVPTAKNLQGKAYALAVLQRYPDVQEVMVQFYHPHIEVDLHKPEYTHVFSRSDMDQMELDIRLAIARKHRAQREGWGCVEIRPTPKTNLCLWCKHLEQATCPALSSMLVSAVEKYERIDLPTEVRPSYIARPEDIKQAQRLFDLMEKFAKAGKARIRDMVLTEGVEVPGLKIVTKADREIVSIHAVHQVAQEFGVTQEQFEGCLNLPITKVETLVKSMAIKGKGAERVRQFQQQLEENGAVKKGKPYSYLVEAKEDTTDV